jgi:hypothetical protein
LSQNFVQFIINFQGFEGSTTTTTTTTTTNCMLATLG